MQVGTVRLVPGIVRGAIEHALHCALGAAAPEWRLAIEVVHNGNDGARAGIGENENDVVCRSQPPLAADECKEPIVLWRIGSFGERER